MAGHTLQEPLGGASRPDLDLSEVLDLNDALDRLAFAGLLYELARVAALQGRRGPALDGLREAVDCGYTNRRILTDPDLASLRGSPEFEAVAARVRERMAAE